MPLNGYCGYEEQAGANAETQSLGKPELIVLVCVGNGKHKKASGVPDVQCSAGEDFGISTYDRTKIKEPAKVV